MNDTNGKAEAPSAALGSEKIVGLAQQVFERHAHDGEAAGPTPPGDSLGGMGAPGAAPDPLLVSKAAGCAIKAIDAALVRRLGATALRLTKDQEFAAQIVADTRLTRDEIEQIGLLSAMIARKYALVMAYAPECALGVILIGYGARFNFAITRLAEIARTLNTQPAPAPAGEGRAA